MRKIVLMARVALVLGGCGTLSGGVSARADNMFNGETPTFTLGELSSGNGWQQILVSPDGKVRADVPEVSLASDNLIEGDVIRLLGAMPDVYYTQGDVVTLGGESFLAAYRLSYTPEDVNRPFKPLEAKYPYAKIQAMPKEQVIKIIDDFLRAKKVNLVMLNLHNVGSVITLREFDADEQLGFIEKRMGDEFDKSQVERKQAAAEAARVEAARKAALAKKGARPASSKTRPATK